MTSRSWASLCAGLFLALSGVALIAFWPALVDIAFQKELRISPGSKRMEYWEVTPVPMYIDIYFFNWTNPGQIEDPSKKPSFTEMGPYRFYEKRSKVGLVWNRNKTVSFRQVRHWYFAPDQSKGSLEDVVTTVNIIPLMAARSLKHSKYYEKVSLSLAMEALRQTVATRRTVEELLFKGYPDKLLDVVHRFPILTKEKVDSDRFGWFYQRNGTDLHDGVFNMETGEDDLSRVGRLVSWNSRNTTGYFEGACGAVGGTTGEVFPPGLTPKDRLGLFSPDLCRTIYLEYEGVDVVGGVEGLRYGGGEGLVDSGQRVTENECFCSGGDCPPAGLLNLTGCRRGAPLFLSYPHFHLGDPALLAAVNGLSPDPDKHGFYMTVQPTLGIPIELFGRFQINLMLEKDDSLRMLRYLPKRLFMPVMWFDQRARLTEELAREVRWTLAAANGGLWVGGVCLAAGLLLATASAALDGCRCRFGAAARKAPPKPKARKVPNVPLTRRQTEEPLIA